MIMENRLMVARRKYDPDATRYINAVQLADDQALEPEVAMAVDAFVKGCKADSAGYAGDPTRTVWDALQACCIMCGARTISGALVPLVGTAPQGNNFTSTSYNRKTGLLGVPEAFTYIDTNRAFDAGMLNDAHFSVYRTDATIPPGYQIGTYGGSGTSAGLLASGSSPRYFLNSATGVVGSAEDLATVGFFGASRSDSLSMSWKSPTASGAASSASGDVSQWPVKVFSTTSSSDGSPIGYSSARIAFYSVGSSLSLSALDSRVSTLVSQIAAAI